MCIKVQVIGNFCIIAGSFKTSEEYTIMPEKPPKILITSALPYANGSLHLGHLVEHIQTDIWARFHKMSGYECYAICGDDAHGTPIMLKAEQLGIKPEELVANMQAEHENDFAAFGVHYDNYHTTHSPENKELASLIYKRLEARGDIVKRTIEQAFDPEKNLFLPDRYVKGECPRCGAVDQYGDNCEACGATYAPTELKNPVSVLSGVAPIQKKSEHFFFDLPKYKELLQNWTRQGHLQEQVANKLDEWFQAGLQQWDISRDAPYFGFEIPDAPNKYFYVWLDAPIGYIASFKNFCDKNPAINFEEFWGKNSDAKLYHFIGKDIIYFHALFWPAMLAGSDFRTPTAIYTHGFLTVDGAKMSKSRGTFIKASTYLDHLNPEYLRYYFAGKLSSRIDDLDLNFDDFVNRVNSDLVGKVVNIASRCAGFISKKFDGKLADTIDDQALFDECVGAGQTIAQFYHDREYARAMREIMALADKANQYIDTKKPWSLAKEPGNEKEVHAICTMGLNLFRLLMIYLKPVLPFMAEKTEAFLKIEPMQWSDHKQPLLNHAIEKFKPLMQRVEQSNIDAMIAASRD